jgi:YidC/Oxa1 family membrane protein insertase
MIILRLLGVVLILFYPFWVNANSIFTNENGLIEGLKKSPNALITERVQENFKFFGLASYYNNLNYFLVDKDSLKRVKQDNLIVVRRGQWLAIVGRFNVLLVQAVGLAVHTEESKLIINNPEVLNLPNNKVMLATKTTLALIAPELDQIRYSHLWEPLAWLTKLVEYILIAIHTHVISNWGLTIIMFSVLLKLVVFPVGVLTVRSQRRVSQVQALLAPQLIKIKENYDGEEAHNHLMAVYKKLGVSPFYTLKPMLFSLFQIPVLIAVFNALGEMPQLTEPFLWMGNLAYPDAIKYLPHSIPLLGDSINLLPFFMTAVTLYSTIIFQNRHAPDSEIKRQKRNLYFMAVVFFVLFYPFPAVMVFYWTLANIMQTIQQQIIKI